MCYLPPFQNGITLNCSYSQYRATVCDACTDANWISCNSGLARLEFERELRNKATQASWAVKKIFINSINFYFFNIYYKIYDIWFL